MRSTQKRLPLPRGWWICRPSLFEKQSSSLMTMYISRSSSYGPMAVCTVSTCFCRCSNISAHECAICHGWREPLPEWDFSAEPTATELINPNSQHQDYETLYYDVYILCRLPGWSRCKEQTAEWLHKEALTSINEHLTFQWPPKQQAVQQMQQLAENPRPDPPTVFTAANQKAYKDMMALARDAQQWALAMAAIMKEERGCSTCHQHPTDHQCSASHRRSRSSGHQEESSWVTSCNKGTETRPESSQGNWRY